MKDFLTKYWSLIGLLAAYLIDQKTGIVDHIVKDPFWIKNIYLLGTLLYGYFFTSSHNKSKVKKQ